MTPLNDAVGKLVNMARAANANKTAIVIMTDGHENASRELTTPQAKALLDECRAKGWQVVFLGADFDNAAQGASYGAGSMHTAQVAHDKLSLAAEKVAALRSLYSARSVEMRFSEEDKEELKRSN
jgi:hypothetical protein